MRFRFHLSSWFLLFITASALVGLHVRPIESTVNNEWTLQQYGFPFPWWNISKSSGSSSTFMAVSLIPINFAVVLLPLAFLLEPGSRRIYYLVNVRGFMAILVAFSIGTSLAFHTIYSKEVLGSSLSFRKTTVQDFKYSQGWPYAEYGMITVENEKKVTLHTSTGTQSAIDIQTFHSKGGNSELIRQLPTLPRPWPVMLANFAAVSFITASVFIITYGIFGTLQRRSSEPPPQPS